MYTQWSDDSVPTQVYQHCQQLYLQHYSPTDYPKFYANVLNYMYNSLPISMQLAPNGLSLQIRNGKEVLYYFKLHEKLELTNQLRFPKHCETIDRYLFDTETTNVLIGWKSMDIAKLYRDSENVNKACFYFKQSFQRFVLNSNEYSLIHNSRPFNFMIELCKFIINSLMIKGDKYYKYKHREKYHKYRKRAKINNIKQFKQNIGQIVWHLCNNVKYLRKDLFHDRQYRSWCIAGDYLYNYEKNFDKAILCYKKSVRVYTQWNNDAVPDIKSKYCYNLLWPYNALWEIYSSKGDFDQCYKYLKLSMDIGIMHNRQDVVDNNQSLIPLYRDRKWRTLKHKRLQKKWTNAGFKSKVNGIKDQFGTIDIGNHFLSYFNDKKVVRVCKNLAMMKQCCYFKCLKKDIKLKKCKQCLSVFYCSKICQKRDWIDQHRESCKPKKTRDMFEVLSHSIARESGKI